MGREIRRICVLRIGGMGDILMTLPAVRAVARRFPDAAIDFIVGRGMGDVVSGLPYVHDILEIGPRGEDTRPRNFFRFLSGLRPRGYDLFINFQPSVKTLAMTAASGARRVVVFRKDRRAVRGTGRVPHGIDDFLKDVRALGITDLSDRRMDFFVPDDAKARVAALLAGEGVGPDDPVLAVNPGGTRQINRWPPERFAALLDRAARDLPGVRLVLTGGRDDRDRTAFILANVAPDTRVVDVSNRLSIKEMGALLARVSVFVTGDTGPMHIGSAVGTPLVVLSGAADPDRTGPLNPGDLVVIKRDLGCVPCRDRRCRRHDIACMNEMPVEAVFAAARQRVGAGRSLTLPMASGVLGAAVEPVAPTGLIRSDRGSLQTGK